MIVLGIMCDTREGLGSKLKGSHQAIEQTSVEDLTARWVTALDVVVLCGRKCKYEVVRRNEPSRIERCKLTDSHTAWVACLGFRRYPLVPYLPEAAGTGGIHVCGPLIVSNLEPLTLQMAQKYLSSGEILICLSGHSGLGLLIAMSMYLICHKSIAEG